MNGISPTYDASEVAQNCRSLIKNNMDIFWRVFKPLAVYIVGLLFFDVIVSSVFFAENALPFRVGELLATYFLSCLIICWHRVVLHGTKDFIPMNPFKPKKVNLFS